MISTTALKTREYNGKINRNHLELNENIKYFTKSILFISGTIFKSKISETARESTGWVSTTAFLHKVLQVGK